MILCTNCEQNVRAEFVIEHYDHENDPVRKGIAYLCDRCKTAFEWGQSRPHSVVIHIATYDGLFVNPGD